jgi:hypothetical protein
MESTTPKTTPKITLMNAYEKEICSKKIVVRLKVEDIKFPPPRRLKVGILFSDGTTKIAEAVLVSAYTSYAYYDLSATDAREVYPYVNNIREIRIIEE